MLQDGEIVPELQAEVLERIISRPEDLPDQVEKNIRKYKTNLLRILEVKTGKCQTLIQKQQHNCSSNTQFSVPI